MINRQWVHEHFCHSDHSLCSFESINFVLYGYFHILYCMTSCVIIYYVNEIYRPSYERNNCGPCVWTCYQWFQVYCIWKICSKMPIIIDWYSLLNVKPRLRRTRCIAVQLSWTWFRSASIDCSSRSDVSSFFVICVSTTSMTSLCTLK